MITIKIMILKPIMKIVRTGWMSYHYNCITYTTIWSNNRFFLIIIIIIVTRYVYHGYWAEIVKTTEMLGMYKILREMLEMWENLLSLNINSWYTIGLSFGPLISYHIFEGWRATYTVSIDLIQYFELKILRSTSTPGRLLRHKLR